MRSSTWREGRHRAETDDANIPPRINTGSPAKVDGIGAFFTPLISTIRQLLTLCLLIFAFISLSDPLIAADSPFDKPANWGGTGLMEIPNARILTDGAIRGGIAYADPYIWYTAAMGVLPGLEASFRYTDITNISTNTGLGSFKDKALDLKYQIFPESRIFPAIAVGMHDIQGTKLFEAQYVVLNRQIFPFDFTFGIGNKRLKGDLPVLDRFSIFDRLGLFGGIEWAVSPKLNLMVEYSPIEYEKDPQPGVPEGAESPVNMGLRWKVLPIADLGLSFQRGDTIGVMGHLHYDLGDPISPKRPDPPLWSDVDRRPFSERNTLEMLDNIKTAIQQEGFENIRVYTDGSNLVAEFENQKYLDNSKAVGRVLRTLLFYSPRDTDRLVVFLTRRQIKFLKISIKPHHLEGFLIGDIPQRLLNEIVTIETVGRHDDMPGGNYTRSSVDQGLTYDYGIKPEIKPYLNDLSGVFSAKVGVKPHLTVIPWKGGALTAWYDIPFYSNVESSIEPVENAVRSDFFRYLDNDLTFEILMFDQVFKFTNKTFGRISGGYLEYMYMGIGGELLTFVGDGRLAFGIEGDWVKKREPGTHFELGDLESHTILGNAYYHMDTLDMTFNVKYGRFLAGDVGWRFQVGREYDSGIRIGAWLSKTDSENLTRYNRGYDDKGVFLSLPTRLFFDYETNRRYNYAISPWTRDVAATVTRINHLYDLSADLMPFKFKSNIESLNK